MENTEQKKSSRILSIDALRGFDMFWITGGDSIFPALFTLIGTSFFLHLKGQLDHSAWNGFTFYDLIFPLFLFITGVSLPLSINRRLEKGESKKSIYYHIIKRTLILYFLGLVCYGFFDFDFVHLRYTGVLNRIGFCYFFAALIMMNTKIKGQVIWAVSILLAYWAILKLIPVPGYGAGNLTPEGNLCAWIDQHFLPGRFCCYPYGDNEGYISTIPAVVTVLLGVLTGQWLREPVSNARKAYGLLFSGIILIILANIWGLVFPINKILWTSSYVLLAAGFSQLLLCLFFWLIDIRGYSKWAFPFIVIGLNPITIYVAQAVFDFGIIANIFIHGFTGHLGAWSPFILAISIFGVKWLFLYFLYKKKIFLKV